MPTTQAQPRSPSGVLQDSLFWVLKEQLGSKNESQDLTILQAWMIMAVRASTFLLGLLGRLVENCEQQ